VAFVRRILTPIAAASLMGLGVATAPAEIIKNIGGGWQATIFDEQHVDLATDYISFVDNVLVIEKFAEFIRVDPLTGLPEPVLITFQQTAADAQTISRIVITDEVLINHTGLAWTSFRNILVDSGQAAFNQALSSTFSISPYTTRTYNGDSSEVEFGGGVVPNNGIWTPGLASGGLWIDVNLRAEDPVTFTLKELPVPEPTTGLLALIGSAVMFLRRR
jgi:hypothetical protein